MGAAAAFVLAGLPVGYWIYIAWVPDAWTASLPETARVLFAAVVPPVLAALLVIPWVYSLRMRAVFRVESEGNHLRLESEPERLLRAGGTAVLTIRAPRAVGRARDPFMIQSLLGERPRHDLAYHPPQGAPVPVCKGSTSYLDTRGLAESITRLARGSLEEHRPADGGADGIRRTSWEELDTPFARKAAAAPERHLGPPVPRPARVEIRRRGSADELLWRSRLWPLIRVAGLWCLPMIAVWFGTGMAKVPFDNLWAHGPFLVVMAIPLLWFVALATRRMRVEIFSGRLAIHKRSVFGTHRDTLPLGDIEEIFRDRHEVGLLAGDRLVRIPHLQPDAARFVARWIGETLVDRLAPTQPGTGPEPGGRVGDHGSDSVESPR